MTEREEIPSQGQTQAINKQPDVRSFGQIVRDVRRREGLSQRKLASFLQVDESTISRLEIGTRKPPRNPEFYLRLRSVQGFTEVDIHSLLGTNDAPRWLASLHDANEVGQPTFGPQHVNVLGITVQFTVDADVSRYSPGEIKQIQDMIGQVIHWRVMKEERQKSQIKSLVDKAFT